jgi:outer membrane protein OmpA-like peptidoglycan-associated protein
MNRRVQISGYKPLVPAQVLENSNALNTSDTISAINLENIYFYPDKPILLQESFPYLQELARQLKNSPVGAFEIIGHVNYQSQLDSTHLRDLYLLSELRAKAVYDYLLEFSIPATRMRYKGMGNSQPLFVSPKNEEEKRKNMRVQVVIMRK